MTLRARILGSGGFIPTGERETSCLLLDGEEGTVVVDAGTGLRRLVLEPALLRGRTRLDLVLTHFHADHTASLPFLAALDGVQVTVWGPGAALYGTPTAEVLASVQHAPAFPDPSSYVAAIEDLPVGEELVLGGLRIATRAQHHHADPTTGLRIEDRLVWCTDTAYDEGTAGFARGAEVLCHDAWGHGPTPDETASHTTGAQAAALATAAGVARLVLIHAPPLGDLEALLTEARAGHPDVVQGRDEMEVLAG